MLVAASCGGELRAMVDEPRRDFCFVEQLGLIDGGFREAREGITSTSPLRRNTRRQCYWRASRSVYFDGAQYLSPCGSFVASSVRIIQATPRCIFLSAPGRGKPTCKTGPGPRAHGRRVCPHVPRIDLSKPRRFRRDWICGDFPARHWSGGLTPSAGGCSPGQEAT